MNRFIRVHANCFRRGRRLCTCQNKSWHVRARGVWQDKQTDGQNYKRTGEDARSMLLRGIIVCADFSVSLRCILFDSLIIARHK